MHFRLRSLFLAIAAAAVIAAILGAIRQSNRPTPITTDLTGKQALAQLSAADSIKIELHTPQGLEQLDVPSELKSKLTSWLTRAIRDRRPAKYEIGGKVTVNATINADWSLMNISDFELGIRIDAGNYWRGLSRQEFEKLLQDARQRKSE